MSQLSLCRQTRLLSIFIFHSFSISKLFLLFSISFYNLRIEVTSIQIKKEFKYLEIDYQKVINHAFLSCCWEANRMKSCFTLFLTSDTILTLILHSWNKYLLNLIESTNSCLKMSTWLDFLKEQINLLMFCTSNNWQYPTFEKSNIVKIANSIIRCIYLDAAMLYI